MAYDDPVWQTRSEALYFQFGPFMLGTTPFKALTLLSNPFVVHPDLKIPLENARAMGCQGVVNTSVPVGPRFSTIHLECGALRYATRYGDRYVVDLEGSFAEYLRKFSKKSRGNLQRTVKKIAGANGELADLREYRSPSEIMEFRDIAIAISHRSYKKDIGWGFQENEDFARQLGLDASSGGVRGYVLILDGEPAAYAFCRIDHDVIVYKHIGYDKKFTPRSPGTALLYLMIKRFFDQPEFRLLDFDGTEYYAYKEFFATRAVRCARVVWFRPTFRNLALVIAHWIITATWRLAGRLRELARRGRREWVSARRQVRQPRRWTRSS
jgi:CelD/BcsL family acetyltransferase involved in cellulose biosynthesis